MKSDQHSNQCSHCRGTRKHPLDKRSIEACERVMRNRSDNRPKDGNKGERRSYGPR